MRLWVISKISRDAFLLELLYQLQMPTYQSQHYLQPFFHCASMIIELISELQEPLHKANTSPFAITGAYRRVFGRVVCGPKENSATSSRRVYLLLSSPSSLLYFHPHHRRLRRPSAYLPNGHSNPHQLALACAGHARHTCTPTVQVPCPRGCARRILE